MVNNPEVKAQVKEEANDQTLKIKIPKEEDDPFFH